MKGKLNVRPSNCLLPFIHEMTYIWIHAYWSTQAVQIVNCTNIIRDTLLSQIHIGRKEYSSHLLIVWLEKVKDSDGDNEHESSEKVKPSPPPHPQFYTICDHISKCLSGLQEDVRTRSFCKPAQSISTQYTHH